MKLKKKFISNRNSITQIKDVQHNGDDYMVFPVVMAKVGVMNNFLYRKELLENSAKDWNGVKVTLRHPSFNGKPISVNFPKIVNKFVIGEVYNVKFENDSLKGEVYINKAMVNKKGYDDLIQQIKDRDHIDVSTGLIDVSFNRESGDFQGKSYDYVINSMKTDHLAILPDEKGACSVEDGCGTMFNSSLSFHEINMKIYEKLGGYNDEFYIEDVYEDHFILNYNGKKYEKVNYSINDDEIVLGDRLEVEKQISYETVQNNDNINCSCKKDLQNGADNVSLEVDNVFNNSYKGKVMKKQTIEFLNNAKLTHISDDDKKNLDSLSDATLEALQNCQTDINNKNVISDEELQMLNNYKAQVAKEETEVKEEFKKLFNADDKVVDDMKIDTMKHLINEKKSEKKNEDENDEKMNKGKKKDAEKINNSKVDYSGKAGSNGKSNVNNSASYSAPNMLDVFKKG